MHQTSLWEDISERKHFYPPLNETLETDVAIIGGGITGLTAAYELSKSKKKVIIIDADKIGCGTTGFSTGNLYIAVQSYYQNIVSKFNFEVAKLIAHSRKFAMNYIENTIYSKNIYCHFTKRPWYIYTNDDNQLSFLKNEIELFKKMDFNIDTISEMPLTLPFKKAYKMDDQARFNPLSYVLALSEIVKNEGCDIFENTRVLDINEKNNLCYLQTKNGTVIAKNVIIATHIPIGVNTKQFFTAPYRSYVVGVKLKNNQYPEGHFWDLENPHHATCTHSLLNDKPELLLVAGSHHKTGQNKLKDNHFLELKNYLNKNYDVSELVYQWSAQHYRSSDDVPYIGLSSRLSNHIYMATGFSADGLVYGTLSGIILSDAILEKKHSLNKIYDSNRLKLFSSLSFLLKENSNVMFQYLKDYPFKETKKIDLEKGEGKVIEKNGEKWAVSRDENNKIHMVSAVCTHMKCIVNWNAEEKTWDCPCHGSRFSCEGRVLEGPAMFDLKKFKE